METLLRQGLTALGLPADAAPALARYGALLIETNKVMNLTAITDPADVAALHFLDSAALLTLEDFRDKSVADVGTGAGFPGLPLKVLEPTLQLTLLDALQKRITFLETVCRELGLTGVECVHGRAEAFAADRRETFDIVTSRAVANLQILAELCLPLVKVGGRFLAMKAVDSDAELEAARRGHRDPGRARGSGPGLRHSRHPGAASADQRGKSEKKTPEKYPRTFAKIKKNPL